MKKLFYKLRQLRGKKGFTLVGVLVASVVGLIVVTGISQLFSNMSGQLRQMELKTARVFFDEFIGSKFRTGCEKTLEPIAEKIAKSNTPNNCNPICKFHQLRNSNGKIVLDLLSEEKRLKQEYGIGGNIYFQLKCVRAFYDHDSNPATPEIPYTYDHDSNPQTPKIAKCDYTDGIGCKTFSCQRWWTVSLISQTLVKGLPKYNRHTSFEFEIEYPAQPVSSPTPTWNTFTCNNITVPGSGSGGSPVATKSVNLDNNNILIGEKAEDNSLSSSNISSLLMTSKDIQSSVVGSNQVIINPLAEKSGGSQNVFIGSPVGNKNNSGSNNTFIGYKAGDKNVSGSDNIFIGSNSGLDNKTGLNNVFIGSGTGSNNTTGSGNIFIGSNPGNQSPNTDNHLVIGNSNRHPSVPSNPTRQNWLVAEIGTSNIRVTSPEVTSFSFRGTPVRTVQLRTKEVCLSRSGVGGRVGINCPTQIGGVNICLQNGTNCPAPPTQIGGVDICLQDGTNCPSPPPSSKTIKKNIKPFKKFKHSLDDILNTPLFTYQYKEKQYNPKKRMGIIAEELPKNLQIKEKGKVSRPDWPSIYGSFWAGIKALHSLLLELKEDSKKETSQLKKDFLDFKQAMEKANKELKQKNKNLEEKNKELLKEIEKIKSLILRQTEIKNQAFSNYKQTSQ